MSNEIEILARALALKWVNAYDVYKPQVKEACSRLISEDELEVLLSKLLEVCDYSKNYELFEELCETYSDIYSALIHDFRDGYYNIYVERDF